jgi:hypothetical protein
VPPTAVSIARHLRVVTQTSPTMAAGNKDQAMLVVEYADSAGNVQSVRRPCRLVFFDSVLNDD